MSINDLFNILLCDRPSFFIKEKENDLFNLIPEFQECKGFNQNNEWHIYDVYEHILHVVDNVPADIVLRLAALFHDIGKPSCYSVDNNGVGHFYGHYKVSKKIFDEFADRNNIDSRLKYFVGNLIFYHDINISKLSGVDLFELYTLLGVDGIKKLFDLKRADLLAQNSKFHYILDDYSEQEGRLLLRYK